jgi:hypothetical protein
VQRHAQKSYRFILPLMHTWVWHGTGSFPIDQQGTRAAEHASRRSANLLRDTDNTIGSRKKTIGSFVLTYAKINNLADRNPPGLFDVLGRMYHAGVRFTF